MMKRIKRPIVDFFYKINVKVKDGVKTPIEESSKYSIEKLKTEAFKIHPVSIFKLSEELWKVGEKEEALRWYYIGALRYRIRLDSIKDTDDYEGEHYYFEKIEIETKPIFLEWAGGNPIQWVEQIKKALEWDANNINMFTSKSKHVDIYASNIENMKNFIENLVETSDDILFQRKEQGLENRV